MIADLVWYAGMTALAALVGLLGTALNIEPAPILGAVFAIGVLAGIFLDRSARQNAPVPPPQHRSRHYHPGRR